MTPSRPVEPLDPHVPRLRALARSLLASRATHAVTESDVVQITCLHAHRRGHLFRGTSPQFYLWLCSILRRVVYNLRRERSTLKRDATVVAFDDVPSEPVAAGPSPSSEAGRNEFRRAVRDAIDRLPDDDRRLLLARLDENLDFEKLAERFAISESTARRKVGRALYQLHLLISPAHHAP